MNEDEGERGVRRTRDLRAAAETDRNDLLAILTMRFGAVPAEARKMIETCSDLDTLERLILVAANAPGWQVFLDELITGGDEFKLVGARFEPLSTLPTSSSSSSDNARTHGEGSQLPATQLIQILRPKEH